MMAAQRLCKTAPLSTELLEIFKMNCHLEEIGGRIAAVMSLDDAMATLRNKHPNSTLFLEGPPVKEPILEELRKWHLKIKDGPEMSGSLKIRAACAKSPPTASNTMSARDTLGILPPLVSTSDSATKRQLRGTQESSERSTLTLRVKMRQYMRRNCPHSTRDMKATAQVLANLDLLERILRHVPCNTLLLSQRVSQSWHDIILVSSQLQQSLFLEPCGPSLSPFGNPDEAYHDVIAPDSFRWATKLSSSTAYAPIENPLMSKMFPLVDEGGQGAGGGFEVPTHAQLDAVNRPDASWRKMFPCQPPVARLNWYYDPVSSLEHGKRGPLLHVARGYIFDNGRFETRGIHNKRGLTLEDIARKCLTICIPGDGVSFRLFLHSVHTWRRPSAEVITAAALENRLIEKYQWQQPRCRNMLSYMDGRFLHIYDDGGWSLEKLNAFRDQRRQLDALVRKAGTQGGRGHTGNEHELRYISTSGDRGWVSEEFEI